MGKERESLIQKIKNISPVRLIVSSFFIIIMIGSVLLCLPFSARSGRFTGFTNALFTATSATCVTGLVPFDTWTHWSEVGQAIILMLIQLGGLGLVSFTTGFTLLMRRKLDLRDMKLAQEYTSGNITDVPRLIRTILIWTFACEAVGTLLLSIRFFPLYGVYGLWISMFLSVSAYCNAGFDILGFLGPNTGLTTFVNDPLVSLTIAMLIVVGGIGFIVINDLHDWGIKKLRKVENHPHLTLHTHIVLRTTAILLIAGTLLFMLFEYRNTLSDMNFFQKLNASFFQSVTARTAGYSTINVGDQHDITQMLTIVLMFIGASPASTGGGIKTTTFVVLIATVFSILKGREDTVLLKRRVDKTTIYRSLTIVLLAILIVTTTTAVITIVEEGKPITALDALFESVSAFATVGLTTGITHMLTDISKLMLSLTMFIGRVGPISLVLALTLRHRARGNTILPEGKIIVG